MSTGGAIFVYRPLPKRGQICGIPDPQSFNCILYVPSQNGDKYVTSPPPIVQLYTIVVIRSYREYTLHGSNYGIVVIIQ